MNYGRHSLRAFLTNFSILVEFPQFHKLAILFQNDVRFQHWLNDSTNTPSCVFPASLHMSHHHTFHVITSFVIPLSFTEFFPAIMSLVIPFSLLNSFDINDNHFQQFGKIFVQERLAYYSSWVNTILFFSTYNFQFPYLFMHWILGF